MSRPSDHEFDTEFGGGLEAWHPDCAGLAWARLYAEAQRARAAEEAAEAKLREAEEDIRALNQAVIEEQRRADKAEVEMSAILDTMPADVVVRVREGAGPESVAASLAVSIAKLRGRMEKAERECGRLQKMLDVCSVVHGHNVKLKSERDEARKRLREHSWAFHARTHGELWMDCQNQSCLADRAALGEKR